MSSEKAPLIPSAPPRGVYAPPGPHDSRSPCPVINSLANHGYIHRNGKNIQASEFYSAMALLGLSRAFRAATSYSIFNERVNPSQPPKKLSFLQKFLAFLRNPWTIMAMFGMRRHNQVDKRGRKVLDLSQLATHGAVEHDVSLSRRDALQEQGNCKSQPDLVKELLECSSDGKKITIEDLSKFRKSRIRQQLDDNPRLEYGNLQHTMACGEMALILSVFGNNESVPCSYVSALFKDERLPVDEGWKRRWWWTVGLIELGKISKRIKALIGLTFPSGM